MANLLNVKLSVVLTSAQRDLKARRYQDAERTLDMLLKLLDAPKVEIEAALRRVNGPYVVTPGGVPCNALPVSEAVQ